MPNPDGPTIRIYSDGNEVFHPPVVGIRPQVSKAPPHEAEILAATQLVKSGWSHESAMTLNLGAYQLLKGTHIYEIVYWQTQLNWLDVRDRIRTTDAQGKGKLRYPITDNPPSNRLYFKVYEPTEEEARDGKTRKFLGEVDAKTQVPQFPIARPGDFAHKTGFWRAEGTAIDLIGGTLEVFVKEGDSMPNLPGDAGVDPFGFQWRFQREK